MNKGKELDELLKFKEPILVFIELEYELLHLGLGADLPEVSEQELDVPDRDPAVTPGVEGPKEFLNCDVHSLYSENVTHRKLGNIDDTIGDH